MTSPRGWFIACILCLAVQTAQAQDRVTYLPDGAAKPITAIGDVVDFTGAELQLKGANSIQRIPAARVQQIETQYQPEHLQGRSLLEQGDTSAAITTLRKALEKEPRAWVDREILSLIVKADLRQQDLSGALRDFQSIITTDPESRAWGIAPLIWSPQVVSDSVRKDMQSWLEGNRRAEQLLAASILLLDPAQGEAAERRLMALTRDTHPILSAYSKAQLWRLDLTNRQVSDVSLERWRDLIERLPQELRPGPQYLLSRGHEVRGELQASAEEALWLPYVYAENELLAARALLDAGESLNRSGFTAESQTLYRELVARYPWSRDAALAKSRITGTQ
ncbi:tetratricopeptide repeat protein [Planctomicrobium piriforme]|uniref:Tetratricopeptide repeat-containing protein n=1 Tax=Planctomicrobium piriforme TaxID=1576369 RepID=A0A1I3B266_9PLAN|nr:tetratricopeptide repeat protein [Planctomicrobium piriforme]SFH56415.1 Tetratricopeptide repeat-containing protein [Planctomicrobium piriforme]